MLVKGTLKGNMLSTETGDFHVATQEAWPDTINGIFEISKITSDSFEHKVSVEGYETVVKIPFVRAKVDRIYSLLYESGEDAYPASEYTDKNTKLELNDCLVENEEPEPEFALSVEDGLDSLVVESELEDMPSSPQSDLSGLLREEPGISEDDEAIELFGKPLSELGDRYNLDHSVGRDVIKRIFQFFQEKGVKLDAKTQSFDLRGLAA
jgi:hypothetical protein